MPKDSPQDVINSYKKSQQILPFLIGGLAILLLVVGVIVLVVWLAGPNKPAFAIRATTTPTVTMTYTVTPVTPSVTPSLTATETTTPTPTETVTPSGPSEYVVQEGDTCWDIAIKFDVEFTTLLAINNFNGTCPIKPNDKIIIPAPGQQLPTATAIPSDLPYGTVLEYTVQFGDTLAGIASRFNTTVDQIIKDNQIKDQNAIEAGTKLKIKANIVTPTATLGATSTSALPPAVTNAPGTATPTVQANITATP